MSSGWGWQHVCLFFSLSLRWYSTISVKKICNSTFLLSQSIPTRQAVDGGDSCCSCLRIASWQNTGSPPHTRTFAKQTYVLRFTVVAITTWLTERCTHHILITLTHYSTFWASVQTLRCWSIYINRWSKARKPCSDSFNLDATTAWRFFFLVLIN